MIIQPDFLDHWRVRQLQEELGGDDMSPVYLLRLWAYCERRQSIRFRAPTEALKYICQYPDRPAKLFDALARSGWLRRDADDSGVFVVRRPRSSNKRAIIGWEFSRKRMDLKTSEWKKKRLAVIARDGHNCAECGQSCEGWNLTIDHIVPHSEGGSDGLGNLQVLCRSCNAKKGAN